MTDADVPLDVAYRDAAFDDEYVGVSESIRGDHSRSGLTAGTVPPPTPAVETTTTGKEKAFAELDAGTEWMEGEGLTHWAGKGTPWAESAPPPPAAAAAAPSPPAAAVPAPAPVPVEAEDPTRKEFADLIAQPSLTDKEYGQASELALDSLDDEEVRSRVKELKAKHQRGAPVAAPAPVEATTPTESELLDAELIPSYAAEPPAPPAVETPTPAVEDPAPPASSTVTTAASPEDQSELDYVDRALIATTRAADKVWNLWDNLGIVAPSDKPGILSGRPSQPVVKSSEAKVAPQAADPAAEVTFRPESSDIRVDFEPLDRPRRQVEATKIILKKFKAAGLSDNMAKAAIINGLAESRMDTFLPAGAEGEKSYGLWHFNQASTGAGYGIKRKDLEDPYWMTDKMIEVIKATPRKPTKDNAVLLSRWITLDIENPGNAVNESKTRPTRYWKEATKIIEEARAELALETTPEV